MQNVVCRGSSAGHHFEVCPGHPWLAGRFRDAKTINDLCGRKRTLVYGNFITDFMLIASVITNQVVNQGGGIFRKLENFKT